jgi:hypothetical protein
MFAVGPRAGGAEAAVPRRKLRRRSYRPHPGRQLAIRGQAGKAQATSVILERSPCADEAPGGAQLGGILDHQ